MTTEKIWFWDIVRTMEPRWVMSSMATWAVWILTMIIWTKFNLMFLKYFAWILSILAIIFFILFAIMFTIRIFKFPGEVKKDLSHPIAANFFAGIFISAAVIVSAIWNVLHPLWWCINENITSSIFYIIALILGTIIPIIVPFMLTISEKVAPQHAIGIWFLPPVGIFVLVFAWNFMALHGIWQNIIPYINIFYMWIAFVLYFLVLSMVYSRLKFHPLPAPEVAPSFVIGLAPVGVSIIALNTFDLVLQKNNLFNWNLEFLHNTVSLLSSMLTWFGFWWFTITILILWYYLVKKSIPYSLWWWALVFPVAAFW
jgi:C4-dicarboxylate transporter/malic acid transport protein